MVYIYIRNRWSEITFAELCEVKERRKTDELHELILPEGEETDTIKGNLRLNTIHPA